MYLAVVLVTYLVKLWNTAIASLFSVINSLVYTEHYEMLLKPLLLLKLCALIITYRLKSVYVLWMLIFVFTELLHFQSVLH